MSTPVDVRGHCYCGAVTYAVSIPAGERPIFTAYCHCDSCRRAHAAPLYHVACVDRTHFALTSGAEHVVHFNKPGGHITRAFCGLCGSRVLNTFGPWRPGGREPVAFFPSTLDASTQQDLPQALRPVRNNQPDECVLDRAFLLQMLAPDPA